MVHTLLDDNSRTWWHWWTSGNYGDTLFCTLWPMNPFRRTSDIYGDTGHARTSAYVSGTSSLHPGGCNFAFADGSVRFLKETIQTWPYDQKTGLPRGVTFDPNGPYKLRLRRPIWRLPSAVDPQRWRSDRLRRVLTHCPVGGATEGSRPSDVRGRIAD